MKRPETSNKNILNKSKFLNIILFEKGEKEKLIMNNLKQRQIFI